MKKTKIILIICIVIAVLLCAVPIPQVLKDGGTRYLCPLVPVYEIYVYNTETPSDAAEDGVMYKKGRAIYLFGIEIFERVYYTDLQ